MAVRRHNKCRVCGQGELFLGNKSTKVYADPLHKLGSDAFFCVSATCFGCGSMSLFVVLPSRVSNRAGVRTWVPGLPDMHTMRFNVQAEGPTCNDNDEDNLGFNCKIP